MDFRQALDRPFGESERLEIQPWVSPILLDRRPADFASHPYQIAPLEEKTPRQCAIKGARPGFTSNYMLKTVHGLIYAHYPQRALYLFATRQDLVDFSKGQI